MTNDLDRKARDLLAAECWNFNPNEQPQMPIGRSVNTDGALRAITAALRLAVPESDAEEDAYVIQRTTELLARIAIIVNGPEPKMTRWSYHDLPEKVQALKDAAGVAEVPAGFVVVPMEPTEAMAYAGVRVWDTPPPDPYQLGVARETYRAMIASAPTLADEGGQS